MNNHNSTEQKLSILCLEDSKADAELLCEKLILEGFELQFDIVLTGRDFIGKLQRLKYDLILSDYNMPGFNGLAALKQARMLCPDVPCRCVSGTIGDDTAVELLKQGATDYVLKDRLARLPFAIQRALSDVREKQVLVKNEQKFKNLVENSQNGIFITNVEGELLFANPALWQMLGFDSLEDFKRFGVNRSYKNPGDRVNFIERLRVEKRVANHELVLKTKNGNEINVIIGAYAEEDRITGTLINITEIKQAENEVRKLSQAVEQSPVCILITDIAGNIIYGNPKVCELTGYGIDELLGKNPRIFQSGETPKEIYRILWETIISGRTWNGELRNRKKNGEFFWEFASVSPIKDENGTITNFLAVKEDITERKAMIADLESAIIKTEASDRLKTAFIHNISHEMRTPLNGILGFSSLIIQPDIPNEDKIRFCKLISASSTRLINTVTNYIDISLIESRNLEPHPKTIDVIPELHSILEQFQPLSSIKALTMHLEIPSGSENLQIYTDIELFRKIFNHLLDNAIKFTREGVITFGFEIKLNSIEFFVKDTGYGISNEAQSWIFENFIQEEVSITRGYEGSGLGLSIAQGCIKLLGGAIRVESEKGQGSVFSFTLPYDAREVSEQVRHKPLAAAKQRGNPVLLIADDDESNLLYLETILKNEKVILYLARNGKEAVEQCTKNPEINLVLMDLKMPVMDGFEATREILLLRRNLSVIAVSAYAMAVDERKAKEAWCAGFISKPFVKRQIIKLMEDYIQ